ncbi:MAG: DUF4384 domain-containing protein [Gemmatimonadetes bacterium]|nr:DUF4384 domain-containing protein [Gemmatimonadota bacterium]
MMIAILLPLLAVSAPHPAPKMGLPLADPPVKVWLNDDRFVRGDHVRVYVKTDRDGYVVVLHAEPDGRVRVLFPLDPGDDNYLQGNETYEVRGRGDREAFTAYDSRGTGVVYAAYSPDPFRFDGLVRQDHWDYRVDAFRVGDDDEADLSELARQMAAGARFEYDLVRYDVSERVAYRSYSPHYHGGWYDSWYDPWYRPWRSGFYVGISFGRPWYYSSWYHDPWYYDPWYDPYYYSVAYYRPYYYRPYYYGSWWYRPYGYRTTVIYTYRNNYYGYPYGWNGYRTGTVTPRRYAFNYVQPGRRTLSLYDPSRSVITARQRIQPPTDIATPVVAVPRVRDPGPVPSDGRRADPQLQGPAKPRTEPVTPGRRATPQGQEPRRGGSDQPRRVEPTTPERRSATDARELARGVNDQTRRVGPATPARQPRGLVPLREGDNRAVSPRREAQDRTLDRPSRPEIRQPESSARPRLERRSAPERRDAPSQARPSEPRARSPQASPPRSSSPPRASSPAPRSGGSSAPRAAPRAPSGGGRSAPQAAPRSGGGGRSAPSAPSSGRRRG